MIKMNELPYKLTIPCQCCGQRFRIRTRVELKDASNFGFRCTKCLKELFKQSTLESNNEFKSIN